jgi:hypothetical protein
MVAKVIEEIHSRREMFIGRGLSEDQADDLFACSIVLARSLELDLPTTFQLIGDWYIELFVQRCDDCNREIRKHHEVSWRFIPHHIRCEECAVKAREEHGYDEWESYYVC